VEGIETPIGFIPRYPDLAGLFEALIGKAYPRDLYDRQFSFYVDNIVARIALQEEAYRKEKKVPGRIFEVYAEQRRGLDRLKQRFGPVVSPALLEQA
jgi:phosphoenolpyruvate carboxykinase (GTP)